MINVELLKRTWPAILYILGGMGLLYALIWIFTFKPQIPLEYKHALDSLDRANLYLINKQGQIDSSVATYQHRIDSLNSAIKSLDIRRTEIHNHYQIIGGRVGKFTPTQIDSFFKARYNY